MHRKTWTNTKKIMLRERSQTQKMILYDSIYMQHLSTVTVNQRSPGAEGLIAKGHEETYGQRNVLNLECGGIYMAANIC